MGKVAATLLSFLALAVLGPTTAPAAPSAARLGYIAPTANKPLMQPVLDRYSNDIRQRLAEATSISIVPITAISGESFPSLATCQRLQLSGFIEPHRHWRMSASSVTIDAGFSITDCYGNVFYLGRTVRTDQRDDDMIPQTQLDAVEAKATSELLRKFQEYKRIHESAWDSLISKGSLSATTRP